MRYGIGDLFAEREAKGVAHQFFSHEQDLLTFWNIIRQFFLKRKIYGIINTDSNVIGGQRMFLKRIELQGFKSFADKSIITFDSDVTGIVGPERVRKE